jgi:hypothetical protein
LGGGDAGSAEAGKHERHAGKPAESVGSHMGAHTVTGGIHCQFNPGLNIRFRLHFGA